MEDNEVLKIFTLRVLSRLKFPQNGYLWAKTQTTFCTKIVSAQNLKRVGDGGLLQSFTLSSLEAKQPHTLSLGTELALGLSGTEAHCQVSSQVPGRVAKPADSILL